MEIQKKLLELQKEVSAIKKDSQNPFFKSAYFDINKLIEVLKPTLNKLGLIINQPVKITMCNDRIVNYLKTEVIDVESGEKLESSIGLPENLEPQKMGSAITYLRRYTLQSLLFLQAEDDDGSVSSPKNTGDYAPRPINSKTTRTIQNPRVDVPFT